MPTTNVEDKNLYEKKAENSDSLSNRNNNYMCSNSVQNPQENMSILTNSQTKNPKKGAFELKELREYLPKICFEKNLLISLLYYCFDFAIIFLGWFIYPLICENNLLLISWEMTMGFFFWAVFVVGHDCCHTSFSNYALINNILGTFAHGFLFVPFSAWKHSHSEHHMYHNNFEKDRSHAWIVDHDKFYYSPHFKNNKNAETRNYTFREQIKVPIGVNVLYGIFHFLSFHYYLIFGSFDFPHFWPYYKKNDLFSLISTVSAVIIPCFVYSFVANSFIDFFFKYVIPLLIFNSWVVIITFLNHHSEDTIVYKNEAFNFVDGAL